MVMRPKSMATVVVVFCSTPLRSSTGSPAALRVSSVRSGFISLTAPTRVVLPTPKPPATSILSATGARPEPGFPCSERSKAIDHLAQYPLVRQLRRWYGAADEDELRLHQVT